MITSGGVKVSRPTPSEVFCGVCVSTQPERRSSCNWNFCPTSCVLFTLHRSALEKTQDGFRTLRACSLLRPSAICAAKRQPSGLQRILPGPKCSAQCRSPPCVNHVIQCHQPLAQMLMTTECGKLLTTLTELERNVDVCNAVVVPAEPTASFYSTQHCNPVSRWWAPKACLHMLHDQLARGMGRWLAVTVGPGLWVVREACHQLWNL